MKLLNLNTNQLNQNGYHKNIQTKGKIGAIFTFPINYTPDDCLSCDGFSILIVDYKELFKLIGTHFNQANDPEGTFRVPDYNITGRFLQPNSNVGIQVDAGLPDIAGTFGSWTRSYSPVSGAFHSAGSVGTGTGGASSSAGSNILYHFNASHSNGIYGKSSTVQPPSQTIHLCIKYK